MNPPSAPSSPRFILRRSFDKPWQWAFLFALLAPATLLFYCVTRKTWKPFFYISGCFGIVVFIWSLVVEILDGLLGTNYNESPFAESLLIIGLIASIYVGGFYSVAALRRSAIETKTVYFDQVRGGNSQVLSSAFVDPLLARTSSLAFRASKLRFKYPVLVIAVVLIVSTGGYAIYTTAVESTIKANPILSAVAKTGAKVKIKHFNCGNMFGFYDSGTNTLQICTSVHDDQLFSSKESTIRHEAWHLIQACSTVKTKNDEWGNFAVVEPRLLADKSLTSDEVKYIADNYDADSRGIESEALLAEMHLTDGQIIQFIDDKCYFFE